VGVLTRVKSLPGDLTAGGLREPGYLRCHPGGHGRLPANTQVHYYLSNDGGTRWYPVMPGRDFTFPTMGMDLHWRAVLTSRSPVLSPRVEQVLIEGISETFVYLPMVVK
jgi:hypothetical protein